MSYSLALEAWEGDSGVENSCRFDFSRNIPHNELHYLLGEMKERRKERQARNGIWVHFASRLALSPCCHNHNFRIAKRLSTSQESGRARKGTFQDCTDYLILFGKERPVSQDGIGSCGFSVCTDGENNHGQRSVSLENVSG